MKYTVQIEGSNAEGTIWQALNRAENVDDAGTPQEIADWTAQNQTIAVGSNWRVRVWEGEDADTGTAPAAEHYEDEHAGYEENRKLLAGMYE